MSYITGRRSYARETYPERPAGIGGLGPTGPDGADGPTGPTGPPPDVTSFATFSRENKNMAALTTTADGDLATATTVASTPAPTNNPNGGYVAVHLNGFRYSVGDGVKTLVFYFSGNGGTTARTFEDIVAGDTCHFNGSVAGFELQAGVDVIDFDYLVPPV